MSDLTPNAVERDAVIARYQPKCSGNGHDFRPEPDADQGIEPFPVEVAGALVLDDAEPLLKGVLYAGDLSVLYGSPGCGKSFLADDLGHAIATGRAEVLGRRVRQAPVLICSLEGGRGRAKRLHALCREKGRAPDLFVYRKSLVLLNEPATVGRLIATIKKHGVRLVIIDTLSRAMAGGNENGPEDMGAMIAAFGSISAETGAHVCIVHHSGKDTDRGSRGHNSLKGAADVEIEVAKSDAGGHTMRFAKVKDDRDGEVRGFALRVVELGQDEDGDPITTCVVDHAEGEQKITRQQPKLTPQHRQAFDILKEAIDECGQKNVPNLKPQISAIQRRTWVEYATKRMLGPTEEATDRAISRSLVALRDAKMIGTSTPWVWVTL